MSIAEILSFAFVTALLIISPGPNGVLIAKTVPASGRGAGFANIAGFVAAFYVHGTLSICGISLLLAQSAQAFLVVKMVGAAYLCWIGIKALVGAWRGYAAVTSVTLSRKVRHLPRAFLEGFLTNALNPKVSMFYLAVFPQFIHHDANGRAAIGEAFLLVTVHASLNVIWFGSMVMLFARLARAARNQRFQRWLKAATGVVFIGFGAKMATLQAG
ncbi:LysE family translocator [Rhizobium ruizarguesonis]|uniref:LysE family translocator n=1 Tax=Rhizobium ruizarguesonis TaxID=2081791 RepID=UPI001032124F|nr:LysE family translocator [Rhizobium ruizarguesonis]TAT84450.1 LysE family translocator [Rhizobium ruizarguesonis]TAU32102.1 LysE family translocator [Rhizobium ruizarguesonis]TAW22264.1 LysE family translocator [Rhizobium ruizarguesonis]